MSVKNNILAIFEANREQHISGEELAQKLGVSRNAVWKAVQALRDDGYEITAVPNLGYSLSGDTDILSAQSISKYLSGEDLSLKFEVHGEVESTNTLAKALGAAGKPEGYVVVANRQSSGRGRLGRAFYSPPNSGVYMSILVRPNMPASESLNLTTAAAVATAEGIDAVSGKDSKIKWVNDVFVGGKKVCGILTEASMDLESGTLEYAVVGIGINVHAPKGGFPGDIDHIAGSVFSADEFLPEVRSRLAAEVLSRFWQYYRALPERSFHEEYCRRSMLVGEDVMVHRGNQITPVHVLSIDEDCHLVVRYEDGTVNALSSGEVSVRPSGVQ